eukprot:1295245-Pyramimonas_sp.AAC.1
MPHDGAMPVSMFQCFNVSRTGSEREITTHRIRRDGILPNWVGIRPESPVLRNRLRPRPARNTRQPPTLPPITPFSHQCNRPQHPSATGVTSHNTLVHRRNLP